MPDRTNDLVAIVASDERTPAEIDIAKANAAFIDAMTVAAIDRGIAHRLITAIDEVTDLLGILISEHRSAGELSTLVELLDVGVQKPLVDAIIDARRRGGS